MIRIAIADDHEIIRNGLALVIEMQKEMEIVCQASSYAELIDTLKTTEIDLLILDLNLGDLNGLSAIENVITLYPDLPILVLSAYPEETYALRAFKNGASGYLNKAVASSELIDAITTIIQGKKYVSHTFADHLEYGTSLEKEVLDLNELLSKREFEVLSLIASGETSKEIAQTLNLSPKTVSTYKSRIMEKLNVHTNSQLFQLAYERLAPSS